MPPTSAPPTSAVDTGTDYGNAGPLSLGSPSVSTNISASPLEPAPETSGFPGTSPTPTPAPAAPGAAYNPLSAQPYTPPTANPVEPVPQAQPLGPNQQAPGAANHAGAASYLGDQILRGYMQGKAQAQMIQAAKLYKQSSGLQKNLDMASQQYYNLAKSGKDPNSPEMQDAKTQVDAAWQANMDFMKQHVAGQQLDKKTGQLKPQQGSILERIFKSDDPAAQSLAVYQGAQALGPPVYHQAAPFLTPQYQQYMKTQAQTAALTGQNELATQQTTAQKNVLQQELNTLNAKRPADLSDEDVERRDQLGDILGQPTEAAAAKRQLLERVMAMPIPTEEPARTNALAQQARLVAQITGKGAGAFTPTTRLATAGSFGEQLDRIALDHHITRAEIPPDVVEAYRQRWARANQVATTTTHTALVDTVDPVTHEPTKTPVALPASKSPAPLPPIRAGWEDPVDRAIPSDITHPVAVAAGTAAYTRTLNAGNTQGQAQTAARVAAKAAQRSLNVQTGTPIPTGEPRKQTPDETKVYNEENTIGKQLTAAEQAARLPDRAAGDAALSSAFARSQVGGRLTNFDIARFSNLGSARMRMEGSIAKGIDGTMTDEQRNMILDNMRVNYQTAHNLAEHYRNGEGGVGQKSSKSSATPTPSGGPSGGGKVPSVDDLENLYLKTKAAVK
jgi:hypothetical protein